MSKLSFIAGFFLSFIIGIPLVFYHDLIGTFVAIIVASMIAASKKGGAAIGLITSPFIYLSPYIISQILSYVRGETQLLYALLLIGYSLLDIMVLVIAIAGLIVGILFGWIGLKIRER